MGVHPRSASSFEQPTINPAITTNDDDGTMCQQHGFGPSPRRVSFRAVNHDNEGCGTCHQLSAGPSPTRLTFGLTTMSMMRATSVAQWPPRPALAFEQPHMTASHVTNVVQVFCRVSASREPARMMTMATRTTDVTQGPPQLWGRRGAMMTTMPWGSLQMMQCYPERPCNWTVDGGDEENNSLGVSLGTWTSWRGHTEIYVMTHCF
ncbi:hypothetical protein BJV78DRAFT_1228832 [Lactifluus subvellereus]|nr:hypothetical protein BJV78DRAFT_1228832 [Lactifluus subvellereus]